MEALFFYFFGTLAVLAALLTITRRDAVTSAFWLIFCFLSVAALFALLNAHFMAILQILLYAGAIMVFFIFVIMFLGEQRKTVARSNRLLQLAGFGALLFTGLVMIRFVRADTAAFAELPKSFGKIEPVSQLLLTRYIFSFEMTGLLLTVAVIGAVHLARREAAGARDTRTIGKAHKGGEHA